MSDPRSTKETKRGHLARVVAVLRRKSLHRLNGKDFHERDVDHHPSADAKRSGEQLGVGVRGAEHERAADRGREARGDHEPKCQAHVAVRDPHSDVALLRLALRRSVRRRLRANLKP